jgi:GT2 family glycosyltransferase
MNSTPIVSTIIVNWNGAHELETCLLSLLEQSYKPLEIIVVDNASTDNSSAVANKFGVRWLPLEQNVGLAPALNHGARSASGELLLFLNNDMRFDRDFVISMATAILDNEDIFAVDAVQYDWDGKEALHLATRLAKKRHTDTICHVVVPQLYVYQQAAGFPTSVLMSCAANMLVRRSMFELLGGFDERLFFGYEDVDLCWRAWVRGWKSVSVPSAVCWHRVGASSHSSEGSRLGFRGILCGRLLVACKLLPLKYVILTWLTLVAGFISDLGRMRWQRIQDRTTVLTQQVKYLGPVVRERRNLYRSRGTSPNKQLQQLLALELIPYERI